MPDNRSLWFFAATLIAGFLLAYFSKFQFVLLFIAAAAVLLPVALLAGFVLWTGLPRHGPAPLPGMAAPGGLGAPWMILAAAAATIVVFSLWTGLDLDIARTLYRPGSGFIGRGTLGEAGRFLGYMIPFVTLAAFVLGWLAARLGWPTPFTPKGRDVIFLGIAMLLGPGLIVNLGMKDHLHRPRPSQTSEFGGAREYRAFYQFNGTCPKNCSFPSGEAAEAFWMLAPASLAPAPLRAQAITAAVVFGVAVGGLRMAFGGHFLSDVVVAGIVMWALLMILRRLLYSPARRRA